MQWAFLRYGITGRWLASNPVPARRGDRRLMTTYFLLGVQSALWVIGFIGTLVIMLSVLIMLFGVFGSVLQWVVKK